MIGALILCAKGIDGPTTFQAYLAERLFLARGTSMVVHAVVEIVAETYSLREGNREQDRRARDTSSFLARREALKVEARSPRSGFNPSR